ncbi:hypothetical protein ACFP1Z_00245 [Streptomyces gamaensis]|uniref:Uncharacterized protein n=1 Tax=Streptomyces gamaensis TaxID=1763542 RepID=A0ABW0YPY9_9ACTN
MPVIPRYVRVLLALGVGLPVLLGMWVAASDDGGDEPDPCAQYQEHQRALAEKERRALNREDLIDGSADAASKSIKLATECYYRHQPGQREQDERVRRMTQDELLKQLDEADRANGIEPPDGVPSSGVAAISA